MNYSRRISEEDKLTQIQSLQEESVYMYYLGYYPKLRVMYHSPFSKDNNPSFTFYCSGYKLFFKDFSSGNHGDILNLVQSLFHLTTSEAINKLYNDLIIKNKSHSIPRVSLTEKKENKLCSFETKIEVILRDFNKKDLEYWSQYYFDKNILNKYDIKPVQQVWLNNEGWLEKDKLWYQNKENNPCYRYLFNGKYKCYKPLEKNKKKKWVNNCDNIHNIQGFKQLLKGDTLILTKSYKDVIVSNEHLKIPSLAFHGENHYHHEKVINWMKKEYKKIIIIYDNDETGINSAKKMYDSYNLSYFHIPKEYLIKDNIKDISDFVKKYGIKELQNLIYNNI